MMAGGIPIGAAGIVAQEVTGSREVGMLAIDAMMGYYLLTFLVGVGLGWRQHRARARFAGRQLSYLDSGNSVKEARPD